MSQKRPVFFISDRTGITAETLGNSLLTQFDDIEFQTTTFPFVNSVEKAQSVVEFINHTGEMNSMRPIIFSTTATDAIRNVIRKADGFFHDLFDTFITQIEGQLETRATQTVGKTHSAQAASYQPRIDAMNFALKHDDGQTTREYGDAQIILIAPSRCGKTPACIYMAMQHGILAANYPLIDEDLEPGRLPDVLMDHQARLFGLLLDPERLSQIRSERRPGSRYASLQQCVYEIGQAQKIYQQHGVPHLDTSTMSIEEMASLIMEEKGLRRNPV